MSDIASAETKPAQPKQSLSAYANFRDFGLVAALILIMLFFQYTTDGTLFRPLNLTNLVLQNSYIIIMALGMLLVIVAGHIDLSVGSVAGFIGALSAMMMVQWGVPVVPAIIVCLIMGGVIGAAQGYWVAYHKIPSFIVTLAGMLVFRGLMQALLGNRSIGPLPPQFQLLSNGFIPDFFPGYGIHMTTMLIGIALVGCVVWSSARNRIKREQNGYDSEPFALFAAKNIIMGGIALWLCYLLATYKGLPNVLIVMAVLIGLFAFVTKHTIIGRRIYAMGGNEKAAKLSGIRTDRLTFLTFVNMGVLAALAGLIIASRLTTATPKAGLGAELDVIAAVFVGGASAMGGVGQVLGAVIGAAIMGVMNNGMSIMGINVDWQQVIKGLVLLFAVVFDVYNKNK
ncbi:multiple monosaccharide ABC transporter permease [Phyllobacterium leguminum]|uniref:Xylose transport system permease protein XylH n=1 Tax=Phyllobacterium leguminum TaxID=314237 RepID=A0A318SXI0_9HYPH|nr:multiple monosaccharide ABC transporter permease [Phyllobacterium leguminum]PYE86723.1 multiple monosaccharide ABC transporter membrane protein [Phyllobacterium leguminum]